jgi:vacuolar-type H+-ATPase subunit F/Vma7
VGKIALIADRATSTYFKIAGIKNSYPVNDRDEAEKIFRRLHSDEAMSLIIVTESIYGWIQPILERTKKEFPLVVSIPGKAGAKVQADALAQLIKRTVGIELKVK